jgi:hypothetical protein
VRKLNSININNLIFERNARNGFATYATISFRPIAIGRNGFVKAKNKHSYKNFILQYFFLFQRNPVTLKVVGATTMG